MGNRQALLVDSYDSFTFNLVQALQRCGWVPAVIHADEDLVTPYRSLNPQLIVIGPGPSRPYRDSTVDRFLRSLPPSQPVFGLCLGMQAMAVAADGAVIRAPYPMHGKISLVSHNGIDLFSGIPNPARMVRYHSLVIDESRLPKNIEVTARSLDDQLPMAISFRDRAWRGVQFHPESIASENGMQIIENALVMSCSKKN